jgi:hypothetical protein
VTDPEETVPNSTTGSISETVEPRHLAPDDAGDRPLIDLSRDPTPGRPDHAVDEGAGDE